MRAVHPITRSLQAALLAVVLAIGVLPAAATPTVAAAELPDRFASEIEGPDGTVQPYGVVEGDNGLGAFYGYPTDPAYYPPTTVRVAFHIGEVFLLGPNGAPIAPGVYPDAEQAWNPSPGRPGLFVGHSFGDCNGGLTGSFTVHEVAIAGDGLPTALAVDFRQVCGTTTTLGSLRFNSDVPAKDLSQDVMACCDHQVGAVALDQHADLPVTFTNRGDVALTLGAAGFTGPGATQFAVVGDTCSSATLGAGSTCSLTIRFDPSELGLHRAHLVLPVSTAIGRRELSVQGLGGTTSTISISGPAGPVFPPDQLTITVHVAPVPAEGRWSGIVLLREGGTGNTADVAADGTATFTPYGLGPGPHEFSAEYTGGGAQFLLPSTSDPFTAIIGLPTQVSLTSSLNPSLSTQPVTITATVEAAGENPVGGTLMISDAFDGSTIASSPVTADSRTVSVTRPFATGSHALTASYSGHAHYGASAAHLTQTVAKDQAVIASGLKASPSTFYPYRDAYRDTVTVAGRTGEPARVVIRVYNASNKLVKTLDLGSRTGSYTATWNGRNASGSILAEGRYRIAQTLTDAEPNVLTATHYVTLSKKRLLWSSHTITRNGEQFDIKGEPGDAWVSTSRSSYARGVELSSGSRWAGVRYAFRVKSAAVYKPLTYRVLGRSTTSLTCWQGLWSTEYGTPDDASAYDLETIGRPYAWYTMTRAAAGRIRSGTAYGEVLCENTGNGRRGFDVAKVQLTYKYAILGY